MHNATAARYSGVIVLSLIHIYHNSDRNYSNGDLVNFTKVSEDYTSLLGQKVKVMFKDGKTNNVLGVYAVSDNTVYNTPVSYTHLDVYKRQPVPLL